MPKVTQPKSEKTGTRITAAWLQSLQPFFFPMPHTFNSKKTNTKALSVHSWAVQAGGCACVCAQSRLTVCDSVDCSPPGSSVHGILWARILEWVATPFSRGSSQPQDPTTSPALVGPEPAGKPQAGGRHAQMMPTPPPSLALVIPWGIARTHPTKGVSQSPS